MNLAPGISGNFPERIRDWSAVIQPVGWRDDVKTGTRIRLKTIKVFKDKVKLYTSLKLWHRIEKSLLIRPDPLPARLCVCTKQRKITQAAFKPSPREWKRVLKERHLKSRAISPCSASITQRAARPRPKSRTTPLTSAPPTLPESSYCAVQFRSMFKTVAWCFQPNLTFWPWRISRL